MRISRLELRNFRTFRHAVFENIPDTVLLVGPNGRGKSSILEAVAGAKEMVSPYKQDEYQLRVPWQQEYVSKWPQHLPDPVKIGQRRAEIKLTAEATGSDCSFLQESGVSDMTATAEFMIETGGHVVKQVVNETAKKLFRFHGLAAKVGFIDYLRANRSYTRRAIGNFSHDLQDEQFRTSFSDFSTGATQSKFDDFKSYVVATQLADFSRLQKSGEQVDSLSVFRSVFDNFFSPKTFLGYRTAEAGGTDGIMVGSPFGDHDTDDLSDGEKETLHILARLFRLRELGNVVLWDTPESHLNAALEARLYEAVRRVAPSNQYWLATHSLELIESVPLECVYTVRQDGDGATIERASGEERRARVAVYRELGANVGLQLVSSVVAFVEGKDSSADKRVLDHLVASDLPGVNFVAGGSCDSVFSAGTRANRLLQEASTNGDFFAVVDRDYRSDDEVSELLARNGRLFIWNVHEIENLFLDPLVLIPTLEFLGESGVGTHAEYLAGLKTVAEELQDWIAGDWAAWELDKQFQPPSRRIAGNDPRGSLRDYTARLKERADHVADRASQDQQFEAKKAAVQELLDGEEWILRLPGKQLLQKYLARHQDIRPDRFMSAATSLIRERSINVPELERLKSSLRAIPERDS